MDKPIPPAPRKGVDPIPLAPKRGEDPIPLLPERGKRALPPPPKSPDRHRKTLPRRPPSPPSGKGPPLFIKIDKYNDVVNSLQKLKTYSLSLRDALDAVAEIGKELQNGLSITHQALDRFNSIIASLDTKITRVTPPDIESSDNLEMEDYAREMHEQMERIRSDLKNVNV